MTDIHNKSVEEACNYFNFMRNQIPKYDIESQC